MRILVRSTMVRLLALAVAGQLLISTAAHADDVLGDQGAYASSGDVTLGGGPAIRPTYEGSDRYRGYAAPILDFNWTWADTISIDATGISAYWHEDGVRLGIALAYDTGRKQDTGDGMFQEGDTRLRGLGDISFTVGPKVFASYSVGAVTFSESVTQFAGDSNGGVLAEAGVSWRYNLTERLTLRLDAGASWEDRKRMQEFFGVTPAQAADSMFPQFAAHAGVKDVDSGVTFIYRLNQHLFLIASADIEKLLDDAARSPITFAATGGTGKLMLGYHF